jgi:antitoxin component of MazEF toxin-antitoxin module
MVKQLRKVGNSTGLIIDKPILDLLGLHAESRVTLALRAGALLVTPVRPKSAAKR